MSPSLEYRAAVPPTPGFYLIRHGGQTGSTIVNLRANGSVESLGTDVCPDAKKLVTMPTFPYEFGPRVVLSKIDGREVIALEAW